MDVSLRTLAPAPRLPLTLKSTSVVARDSSFQKLLAQAGLDRFANGQTPSGNPFADQSASSPAPVETLVYDLDTMPEGRELGTFTSNLLKNPAAARSQAKTILQKPDTQEPKGFHAVRAAASEKSIGKKQTTPERKAAPGPRRDQNNDDPNSNVVQAPVPHDKSKPLSLLHLLVANPSQATGDSAVGESATSSGAASSVEGATGVAPDVTTPQGELAFSLTLQVPEVATTEDGPTSDASPTLPSTSVSKAGADSANNPLDLSPKIDRITADGLQAHHEPPSDRNSSGQDHSPESPVDKAPAELPSLTAPNLNPMLFAATTEPAGTLQQEVTHKEPATVAPAQPAVATPAADRPAGLRPLQRMDVLLQTADQVVRLDIRQIMGTVKLSVHASDPDLAQHLRNSLPDLVAKLDEQGLRPQTTDAPRSLAPTAAAQMSHESQNGQGSGANSGSSDARSEEQQHRSRQPRRTWDDLAAQLQEG